MGVRINGRYIVGRWRSANGVVRGSGSGDVTFAKVPPIVFTSRAARRLNVDFFAIVLPYIANPKVVGKAVETRAEWITKAIRPDFVIAWLVVIDYRLTRG